MKNKLNGTSVLFIIFMLAGFQSNAQNDINKLLEVISQDEVAGKEDANTLLEGYMGPLMKGLGIGMNNGWFNTAASHKSFGMEIGFSAGLAFVPESDLTFHPTNMNLLDDPSGDLPTIFGSSEAPESLVLKSTNTPIDMAPGVGMKDEIGFNAVPFLIPQVGIGIYKGTDIKFRYLPEINIGDDATIGLIGFGLLHDIKQHIPGIKLLPFDLSVMIGYTKISMNMDLTDPNTNTLGSGDIVFNSLVYQAMISKKFSVITFYGGLGYNTTKSSLDLKGDFVLDDGAGITVSDPVSLSFKKGTPKFTAGFRLKFAVITLNFDYTIQNYQSFTMGFGFNFLENDGGTI